jgi:DNA-binding beta-propeller fold protein YncE
MMEQIEDISRRTTDGMNVRFAWGGNAWPVTWYFRHMNNAVFFANNPTVQAINDAVVIYASQDIRSRIEPLLEDRYYRFEYMRMWWPMQDYFNLNVQRVQNTFDFTPENTQAAEIRRGMFDMWWSRDYARYGRAVGGDYSLQNWPVSERLYFYVRKDVAAQVWNLGTGEGTVINPLEDVAVNLCTANWQQRFADAVFNLPVTESGMLNHPLDVAVSADGRVYVAEEFANRVSIFDTEGNFISSLNGGAVEAGLAFNRPNGVSVAPNGDLYVADTWNYRIQAFSPAGDFITGWGQPGQYGFSAEMVPVDGFWGPRDVATDAEGNVYISDTGNKRVRVYNGAGEYLRDIGSGGSGLGQLDEPAGLAVSSDGRLFVADTWNRRVSVFGLDGTALYTFNVRGWYEDLGNRPYLALDEARNVLYVTDPDAGRVLVYDTQGNCVGSFGQPTDQVIDGSQFKTVGGIATDAQGNVYVSDAGAGRVLRFAPFVDAPVVIPPAEDLSGEVIPELTEEVTAEFTAELSAELTAELTQELTEEVQAAG